MRSGGWESFERRTRVTYQTVPIFNQPHCQQVPSQAKPAASPGGCRTFLSATSAGRWTGLQFQAHSLKPCTDQAPGPQRPRQPKRAPELQALRAFTAAFSASGLSNSGLAASSPAVASLAMMGKTSTAQYTN
ncbi:hypothetical protein ACHAQJ_001472 [Trichoderma viride]